MIASKKTNRPKAFIKRLSPDGPRTNGKRKIGAMAGKALKFLDRLTQGQTDLPQ